MSEHIVTLSRELPLPPISVGEKPVRFVPLENNGVIPDKAVVHCSTAVDPADADFINGLPESVGLIANLGVGTDNINLDAARTRRIKVSNTPVATEDTADLAFALILAVCRQVGANERFVRSGSWMHNGTQAAMGSRVHGKTLGLIGFGAIGQAVARRAKGFDCKTLYHTRSRRKEAERETGAAYVENLDNLLEQSDIISLHAPLTEETRGLMGAERIGCCKPGAVLVNTARGALVDEAALARALSAGFLAAAGLDVFEREPTVYEDLLTLENVLLTPHIGSATAECRKDIVERGLANIIAFLEGKDIFDPVV